MSLCHAAAVMSIITSDTWLKTSMKPKRKMAPIDDDFRAIP